MKHAGLAILFMVLLITKAEAQSQADTYIRPTDPLVLNNLQKWQNDKFGILIHFGLYSKLGIVESWALCPEDWCSRPTDDYCNFAASYRDTRTTFNPSGFDPVKWAGYFSRSGARYVIFTMKHHDGFCMYDTKYTDFRITVPPCPYAENPNPDVAKEVFNACRAQGLKVGAYFSKPDWSCPDFWWPYYPPFDRNPNYDITKHPDRWKRYVEFTRNQIREITSDYGKLDILWLDGCWVMPKASINKHVEEFCKYPHDLSIGTPEIARDARLKQPGLLIVDRWVQGPFEDYLTPEQKTPDKALDVPWESCITLGDAWGWIPNDRYKTSKEVIQLLVRIVAKGGNLMLGVGPDGNGELDPVICSRLEEIGAWLDTNGEAIYGTHPVEPFQEGNLAYTADQSGAVYAIYLPGNEKPGIPSEIMIKTPTQGKYKCAVPGQTKSLPCKTLAGGVSITLTPDQQAYMALQPAIVFKLTKK
jgi:alpha-L-fucosidase